MKWFRILFIAILSLLTIFLFQGCYTQLKTAHASPPEVYGDYQNEEPQAYDANDEDDQYAQSGSGFYAVESDTSEYYDEESGQTIINNNYYYYDGFPEPAFYYPYSYGSIHITFGDPFYWDYYPSYRWGFYVSYVPDYVFWDYYTWWYPTIYYPPVAVLYPYYPYSPFYPVYPPYWGPVVYNPGRTHDRFEHHRRDWDRRDGNISTTRPGVVRTGQQGTGDNSRDGYTTRKRGSTTTTTVTATRKRSLENRGTPKRSGDRKRKVVRKGTNDDKFVARRTAPEDKPTPRKVRKQPRKNYRESTRTNTETRRRKRIVTNNNTSGTTDRGEVKQQPRKRSYKAKSKSSSKKRYTRAQPKKSSKKYQKSESRSTSKKSVRSKRSSRESKSYTRTRTSSRSSGSSYRSSRSSRSSTRSSGSFRSSGRSSSRSSGSFRSSSSRSSGSHSSGRSRR